MAFLATYAVGVGLMFLTCDAAWDESAFEAASAIGRVGLSAGVRSKTPGGPAASGRPVRFLRPDQPTSSRTAFCTLPGTGAYFSGSIALCARPWLIERSSVV